MRARVLYRICFLLNYCSNEKASLEKEGGRGREGQPFTPPRATPATMNLLRNR